MEQTSFSHSEIHPSLLEIHSLITQPQSPLPGMPAHTCQLSGLIVVPSPHYATGPVATIAASVWADTINARILSPILTVQAFLPLLTMRNAKNSTIVVACPSISSALSAPFAGPEIAATRALSGFAASLRRELRLLVPQSHVSVVELKLGNFDFGPYHHSRSGQSQAGAAEVLAWDPEQRARYGSHYLSAITQQQQQTGAGGRPALPGPDIHSSVSAAGGSAPRSLHYAVFDALEPAPKNIFGKRKSKPSVVYVGRGARSYSVIGEWVPSGVVGWMLGLRGARRDKNMGQRL